MRLWLSLALLVFTAPAALAQTPVPGSCVLGTATATLNVSDVEATVYNTGSLFFGGAGEAQYTVPRTLGISPLYAAGLWIGGRVNGELRFAGNRYANFQYWPGPLGADARPVNPANCAPYDRIWVVSTADVAAYEGGATPTPDLAAWPVGLGAGAVDAGGTPIVTTDLTRVINLAAGERPVVLGSQTAFWVMNDVGAPKSSNPISNAIGLEVRVHAFSVASPDLALARSTFYRYTLVNRNSAPLTGAYLSIFTDPDLGNAGDDYVHTDTARGMGVVYNSDEHDEGQTGYGAQPPAIGIDLLDGLHGSSYFIGGTDPATSDPLTLVQYYNYQQGLWGDGQVMREGGYGRGTTGPITPVVFPGDVVTQSFWSEENTGPDGPNAPGDRRLVVSTPRFTLGAGASQTFDVALLYGGGNSRLGSVTALRAASDQVQALHDSGALFASAPAYTPAAPAAPTLLAPVDGDSLGYTARLLFDWTAVPGASDYLLELATDPTFGTVAASAFAAADSLTLGLPPNVEATYYWRVTPYAQYVPGTASASRRFTALGPYVPRVDDVEEWDAAGPVATDADGSPTDPSLLNSLNSTATRPPGYVIGAGGGPFPAATANDPAAILSVSGLDFNGFLTYHMPNSYEIRWVAPEEGHAVLQRSGGGQFMTCWETGTLATDGAAVSDVVEHQASVMGGLPRLPFQVWEVTPEGVERPLVATVLDYAPTSGSGDRCYGFTDTPAGGAPLSGSQYERIYVSNITYDEARLTTDLAAVYQEVNTNTAANQVFGRLQVVPVAAGPARPPQAGTRTRITAVAPYGPSVATEEPVAAPGTLALMARPNPVRGAATLRFTVPTAGPARAALYDVLGRRVAVLLDTGLAAGAHTIALDASALAPGVYVVVAESGAARVSRVVTVVR